MTLKKYTPYFIALAALFIINAIYFYPAYSGKKLEQDDIKLGVAKSKELLDYRKETGKQALWTNAMFSGMPTFQINIRYPNNVFEKLEKLFKLYQPAQIGLILFLMFGFFFLLTSYKVNPWVSAIGAIAFGFSAFFIISFDAGHNAKLRAIGYVAPMLMGILLTFKGKYWFGLALTALFAGMAISANHIQITYYSVIIAAIITIVELIDAIKHKALPHFVKSIGILLVAAFLAIGPNVSKLWTTYEYSKETIRGGSDSLRAEKEGKSGGLDKDYAMSWSYGTVETLNLIVPDIMGGGAQQNYEGTKTHDQLFRSIKGNLQQQGYPAKTAESQANRQIASLFYWGNQSLVNGGFYLGASVFFFFILGLFVIRDKRKSWVVASVILAIFMAWGKNMVWFNNILFEYLPLYNKFRVPSMTLVIVFLLVPFLGVLALDYIVKNRDTEREFIKKSLLNSFYFTGGVFLLLAVLGPAFFSFESDNDARLAQNPGLLDLLIEDRKSIARMSAFRSLFYASMCFGAVYLFFQKRLKKTAFLSVISIIVLADLWSFDKQHLNEEDFVKPSVYMQAFAQSTADKSILQDNSYYRVFNLNNPFNDAITSYYHKAVGGYHGAKLQRYQELYENRLFNEQSAIVDALRSQNGNPEQIFRNTHVLNMLNGKYVIYSPQAPALKNNFANGSAWFVEDLKIAQSVQAELDILGTINTKNTAVVHSSFEEYIDKSNYSGKGQVTFGTYSPNKITYKSTSSEDQFVVFSEIYYRGTENDWQAYIDDKPVDHIRVNYVLRGMKIPAGEHEIRFEFKPRAYFAGEKISLGFSAVLALVVVLSLVIYFRKESKA